MVRHEDHHSFSLEKKSSNFSRRRWTTSELGT